MKQLLIVLLFFLASPLIAQIKFVPTDYEIIQDAVDDAKDGDIIIVEEGIYYQQIDFKGKAITVASRFYLDGDTSHISKTILDGKYLEGKDSASLVYLINGEDYTSVLSGFTLQNGHGMKCYWRDIYDGDTRDDYGLGGGAIVIIKSGATIANNLFQNNHVIRNVIKGKPTHGGAIVSTQIPKDKSLVIENNIFRNNSIEGTWAMGGAVHIDLPYGKLVIGKNIFIGNRVKARDSGYGGSIAVVGEGESDVTIENNYIANNLTYSGYARGGGVMFRNISGTIRNNVIVNNLAEVFYTGGYKTAKGGGISVERYGFSGPFKTVIENNTIVNNFSPSLAGGIYAQGCSIEVVNSIVRENNPIDKQIYFATYGSNVSYSNVQGGYNGEGNIDFESNFNDEVYYCLKPNESKCIDSGNPADKYKDVKKANGNIPKPPAFGTLRNDIGAYGGPHSKWSEMGVVTGVEKDEIKEVPNNIYLSQNYPNPFNPSTTIKYSIPTPPRPSPYQGQGVREGLFVSLMIYDILGRVAATLVNENQKPGNYEVTWDAGNYPSGIYFYKLSAGPYSQTRKMILIK